MSYLEWISYNSNLISLLATSLLIIVTAIYVFLTKKILDSNREQISLLHNPIIGIKITDMLIGRDGCYDPDFVISLCLSNLGNSPALEVYIDSEIELRYTNINGEKVIPSRFKPSLIPYIQIGEILSDWTTDQVYGIICIHSLLQDLQIIHKHDIERERENSEQELESGSKLRIMVYYKNNLNQHYKSCYETTIYQRKIIHEPFDPNHILTYEDIEENKKIEIFEIDIPNRKFSVKPIEKKIFQKEIQERRVKRELLGYD